MTSQKKSRRSSRSAWIVAALLLGGVSYSVATNPQWRAFEWSSFVDSLRQVRPGWLAASAACVLSSYVIRVLRWKRLMRPIKQDASVSNIFSATMIGYGAIALLGRAGEFVRPYLVSRNENVPVAGQLSIWLIERLFDMLMILALAGTAISLMDWGTDSELAAWAQNAGYVVVGGAAVASVALFILPRFYDGFQAKAMMLAGLLPTKFQGKVDQFLTRLGEGFRGIRDFPSVAYAFGSSAFMWVVLWLSFDLLLRASLPGYSFDGTQILVFMGILMAGSILQVPGIGGGVQVATIYTLTRVFGVDEEPATATAIVVWLIMFMMAVPVAMVLLARQGLSLKSLSQLESES